MKKLFLTLLIVLISTSAFSAEFTFKLNWEMATLYCDTGQPIPPEEAVKLQTRVYYRIIPAVEWVLLAESGPGAIAYNGTLNNVEYGDVVEFALDHVLNGIVSCEKSNVLSKTVPFGSAPDSPKNLK